MTAIAASTGGITSTSRVPVEGKSSVCAIYMKHRKMIFIIIIISLGQIVLSDIAYTSRTHTRKHARTHTHAHTRTHTLAHTHPPPSPCTLSLFDGSVRSTITKLTPHFRRWRDNGGSYFIQLNNARATPRYSR